MHTITERENERDCFPFPRICAGFESWQLLTFALGNLVTVKKAEAKPVNYGTPHGKRGATSRTHDTKYVSEAFLNLRALSSGQLNAADSLRSRGTAQWGAA